MKKQKPKSKPKHVTEIGWAVWREVTDSRFIQMSRIRETEEQAIDEACRNALTTWSTAKCYGYHCLRTTAKGEL